MASYISNSALLQGWKRSPYSLFSWNIGRNKADDKPLTRELKCCYKATIDGFSVTNFHECCDFKGPCVIIGYTNKPLKFGTFNPEGYRSTDDYYDTFDAFLFYWKDMNTDPIILPKIGGSGAALFDYVRGGPQYGADALFDYVRGGPQYGADGLLIGPPLAPVMGGFTWPDTNSGNGDLRQAKSRLGLSYAKKDGKESLFGDESRATLEEVEVFLQSSNCKLILELH